MITRAIGLALGYTADVVWGDPQRGHPVAGFGTLAHHVERHLYRPTRARGVAAEVVLVGGVTVAGMVAERWARRHWASHIIVTAATTWAVVAQRSLAHEGDVIADLLRERNLDAARERITHLVSRNPFDLDENDVARACVESLAENSSDAVIAPLWWGAVCGVPGMVAYRAINTLDAMVGYRNDKYRDYGWAAARMDDVANYVPARLTVVLCALNTSPARWSQLVRATMVQAKAHPSPNAGVVEAAWAVLLNTQLGGVNTYGRTIQNRGTVGFGPPCDVNTIRAATRSLSRVGLSGCVGVVAAVAVRHRT